MLARGLAGVAPAWAPDGAWRVDGHAWLDLARPALGLLRLGGAHHGGDCVTWVEADGTVVHAPLQAGRVERLAPPR